MSVDFATLALRLDSSQAFDGVTQFGVAMDRLSDKSLVMQKRVTDSSRAMTLLQMQAIAMNEKFDGGTKKLGAWDSMLQQANKHTGEHALGIGRLEYRLAGVTEQFLGLNPAIGIVSTSLLKFGIGTIETVGILAGIAAIGAAYELITKGADAAREANEKLTKSLLEQFRPKTGPESQSNLNYEGARRQQADAMRHLGFLQGSSTDIGVAAAYTSHGEQAPFRSRQDEIERETKLLAEANKAIGFAMAGSITTLTTVTVTAGEEAKKALEAAKKAKKVEDDYRALMNMFGAGDDPMSRAERLQFRADQRTGTVEQRGTIAALGTAGNNAFMKDFLEGLKFTMPNVGTSDGLDEFQKRLAGLLVPFDAVREAAVRLAEDLQRSKDRLRLVGQQFKPGNILSGAASGAMDGVSSALEQFTPGALAYNAVSSGLNYIVSGFTDMAMSMLDGGASAREYARAMRQANDELKAAVAQYGHDDLAASLANNAAQLEQLMKQAHDTILTVENIIHDPRGTADRYTQTVDQINADKAKNDRMIAEQQQYALEDLAVRNLRATGQGSQADLLAFQEKQAREWQAALDANKDATYMQTLKTVENSEMLAYLNGTLQDAVRNSPTGFYGSAAYLGEFANKTGGGGGGGIEIDHGIIRPPVHRLPSQDTNIVPPRQPITLTFRPGALVVDKNGMMNVVLEKIDANLAGTLGAGGSRSQALDLMAKQ